MSLIPSTKPSWLESYISNKQSGIDLVLPYLDSRTCSLIQGVNTACRRAASAPLYKAQSDYSQATYVLKQAQRLLNTLSDQTDSIRPSNYVTGPYEGIAPDAYFHEMHRLRTELYNSINFLGQNPHSLTDNVMIATRTRLQDEKRRREIQQTAFATPFSRKAMELASRFRTATFPNYKHVRQLQDTLDHLISYEMFTKMTRPLGIGEIVSAVTPPAALIGTVCYSFYQIHPLPFTITFVTGGFFTMGRYAGVPEVMAVEEERSLKDIKKEILNNRMAPLRQRAIRFTGYAVSSVGLFYGMSALRQAYPLSESGLVSNVARGTVALVAGFVTGIGLGLNTPVKAISARCQKAAHRCVSIFRCGRNRRHVE